MSKNFILIEIKEMPTGAPDNSELKVALEHLMFAFGAEVEVENLSEDELEARFNPLDPDNGPGLSPDQQEFEDREQRQRSNPEGPKKRREEEDDEDDDEEW